MTLACLAARSCSSSCSMAGTGQQQELRVELVIQSKSLKLTGNETICPTKWAIKKTNVPAPKHSSTASRSSSVDAAVAIWRSGQKSCSLLNQLRCCLLANWAKRISLECSVSSYCWPHFWRSTWSYASATDRGLAITSKALVLSCGDLLWCGVLAMSLFLKLRYIMNSHNSPKRHENTIF